MYQINVKLKAGILPTSFSFSSASDLDKARASCSSSSSFSSSSVFLGGICKKISPRHEWKLFSTYLRLLSQRACKIFRRKFVFTDLAGRQGSENSNQILIKLSSNGPRYTHLLTLSKQASHTRTSFSMPNLGSVDVLEEHCWQKT